MFAYYCIVPLPNVIGPLQARIDPSYKEAVRTLKITIRIYLVLEYMTCYISIASCLCLMSLVPFRLV